MSTDKKKLNFQVVFNKTQGQTVHKLQIATFWGIYIYTDVYGLSGLVPRGLQGSEAYGDMQREMQTCRLTEWLLMLHSAAKMQD